MGKHAARRVVDRCAEVDDASLAPFVGAQRLEP